MIQFILNNNEIKTSLPKGTLLLDFIRYHQRLTGTKIGCREGDCGACSVLVGEIKNNELYYRSATSCLMAIGNANGKHIVTVEGTNIEGLNFIQQSFANEGATQCGFCTPGFMVALAGYALSKNKKNTTTAIEAINGNICRCTGYKSIERAVTIIAEKLASNKSTDSIGFAIEHQFLPDYFSSIFNRLISIHSTSKNELATINTGYKLLAGGTDLYVQQHETMVDSDIDFLVAKPQLNGITQVGNICYVGGATTVTDLFESNIFLQHFPNLSTHIKLVSSTPIRNMATLAGNFVNASPIGDFTIFFMALNAQVILNNGKNSREVPLQQLYKGYKQLAKAEDEYIEQFYFELPAANSYFNFEKVCKRTHLDIASVNTAINILIEQNVITTAHIAAGGIGPIPTYLVQASNFLVGKSIGIKLIEDCIELAKTEIAPISDVRGTAAYKSFLLGQLIKAHFIQLFGLQFN